MKANKMKTLSVTFDVQVLNDVSEDHFAEWVAAAVQAHVLGLGEFIGNVEVKEVAV